MLLDRQALLVAARARVQRAADAAQRAAFAREIAEIREEAAADRRELAMARAELRTRQMTEEDIEALDQADYIVDIVDSLQRATNFADPLAIAIGLVRVARAMGASTPEARTFLALEMIRTAVSLDPDTAVGRWQ
jgi:hypothetical protein